MNFRTTFHIPEADQLLSFGDTVTLLGSCFSDRIGQKLKYYGFDTLVNPFGTLFHPLAIARIFNLEIDSEPRTTQRNGTWFTFEAHSDVRANTEEALRLEFLKKQELLNEYLSKSKLLIITFGSAWGYYLNEEIVANCHKIPASNFQKRLTDFDAMHSVWRDLLLNLSRKFPNLEVLFTVSPVRHTKDGFVENQRSKARMIELIHSLNAAYFPSYELQMDDLRDYRFYEADLIHPNAVAVDYIFEKFTSYKIAASSQKYFPTIHKFRMFEAHQIKPFDQDKFEEHQYEVELKRGLLRCQISGLSI